VQFYSDSPAASSPEWLEFGGISLECTIQTWFLGRLATHSYVPLMCIPGSEAAAAGNPQRHINPLKPAINPPNAH